MSNFETILNRPFIDGKVVEGPEPFIERISPPEARIIGALTQDFYVQKPLTNKQLKRLFKLREIIPEDYTEPERYYPLAFMRAAGVSVVRNDERGEN